MQVLSLIWGILAVIAMVIAFLPFLGWLNWLVVPFSAIGLIVSIVATAIAKRERGLAIAGIVCCSVAILLGSIRLTLGGGWF